MKFKFNIVQFILIWTIILGVTQISFAKECGGSIPCDCGDSIISDTTLNTSLSCVNLNGLNIVRGNLNCNGNSIRLLNSSNESTYYGITILGRNGIKVSNCNINAFTTGVLISDRKEQRSTGWGRIWSVRVPSTNTIIENSSFKHSKISIDVSQAKNSIIKHSIFENETIHSIVIRGENTLLYDNIFTSHKPYFIHYNGISYCYNNIPNVFPNGTLSSCSCIVPKSGMKLSKKVQFCSGDYILEHPITIATNQEINCNGARFSNPDNVIFQTLAQDSSKIKHCNFYNARYAIQYSHGSVVSTYGRFNVPSRNAYIENSSFYSIESGLYYSSSSRDFSFGSSKDLVFINVSKPVVYSGNIENIHRNTLFDNLSKGIHNSYSKYPGKIIFENASQLNRSQILNNSRYKSNFSTVSNTVDNSNLFSKNIIEYQKNNELPYTQVVFALVVKEHLEDVIRKKISVFSNNGTIIIFKLKHSNSTQISSKHNKTTNTITISISLESCNVMLDVVKHLNKNIEYYLKKEIIFNIYSNTFKTHSTNNSKVCEQDFLEQKFSLVDSFKQQLQGNTSLEKEYILPIQFTNSITNYSLIQLLPKNIFKTNEFEKTSAIVISGGLFSNKNSTKKIAEYFTKKGYEVYIIEPNGGDSECETCYNYNYQDIVSIIFPTYFNTIESLTSKKKFIFIGHSNGARSFLDALEYIPQTIEIAFLMGTPGAFTKQSKIISLLVKEKERINSISKNHISISDISSSLSGYKKYFFLIFTRNEKVKISKQLFSDYLFWMENETDTQPYNKKEIPKIKIIGGDAFMKSDGVVPVQDQDEIYLKLNSPIKEKVIYPLLPHTAMLDAEYLYEEILLSIQLFYSGGSSNE
jgi:hypothetical protein